MSIDFKCDKEQIIAKYSSSAHLPSKFQCSNIVRVSMHQVLQNYTTSEILNKMFIPLESSLNRDKSVISNYKLKHEIYPLLIVIYHKTYRTENMYNPFKTNRNSVSGIHMTHYCCMPSTTAHILRMPSVDLSKFLRLLKLSQNFLFFFKR